MTDPEVIARLDRIEHMLALLIEAMADEEEEPSLTMDGKPAGGERDQSQPL